MVPINPFLLEIQDETIEQVRSKRLTIKNEKNNSPLSPPPLKKKYIYTDVFKSNQIGKEKGREIHEKQNIIQSVWAELVSGVLIYLFIMPALTSLFLGVRVCRCVCGWMGPWVGTHIIITHYRYRQTHTPQGTRRRFEWCSGAFFCPMSSFLSVSICGCVSVCVCVGVSVCTCASSESSPGGWLSNSVRTYYPVSRILSMDTAGSFPELIAALLGIIDGVPAAVLRVREWEGEGEGTFKPPSRIAVKMRQSPRNSVISSGDSSALTGNRSDLYRRFRPREYDSSRRMKNRHTGCDSVRPLPPPPTPSNAHPMPIQCPSNAHPITIQLPWNYPVELISISVAIPRRCDTMDYTRPEFGISHAVNHYTIVSRCMVKRIH